MIQLSDYYRGKFMFNRSIIFIFSLFSLPFIGISWFVGGYTITIIIVIFLLFFNLLLYLFSGNILLKWYRTKRRETGLNESISLLFSQSGISKPNIYVFNSDYPAIFTIGTRIPYNMVFSSSFYSSFTLEEQKVLISHEIGHIVNEDVPLNTIVALFAGILVLPSTIAFCVSQLTGFGKENDSAPRFIRLFVMGLVAIPAALLVQLTINRSRVFHADIVGFRFIKDISLWKRTLEKSNDYYRIADTVKFNAGHIHLFTLPPWNLNEFFDIHYSLFITHPAVRSRIKNLTANIYGGK